MRPGGKERHDKKYGIRATELAAQDVVMLHDPRREKDMLQKLAFKWLGPYRITEAVTDKGTYLLEELDGTQLAGTFAGDRLKKFHPRQKLCLGHQPDLDHEIVPNLEDLLASESDDALSELDDFSDSWQVPRLSPLQSVSKGGNFIFRSRCSVSFFLFSLSLFLVLEDNTSAKGRRIWLGEGQHLSYIETLNLKEASSPKTTAWDTAVTGGWC